MNQVYIANQGVRLYTKFFHSMEDAFAAFERMSAVNQSTYTVHIIVEKKTEGLK